MIEGIGEIPKTGDEEIDSLYGIIQKKRDEVLSSSQLEVYNGLIDSVGEYAKNKEREKKRTLAAGSNPLDFYAASKDKDSNFTNVNEYYDIDSAETSNIDRTTQYRMFYKQVVDELKKGKVVTLPDSFDLGAYFQGTAKDAIMISDYTSNRDLTTEELSNQLNTEYKKTMKERLNFMVNNTKSEDLYNQFNVKTQDRYQQKDKTNAELVFDRIGKVVAQYTGEKPVNVPTPETNTANAYNNILSKASGGGRNLGHAVYFDTAGNQQEISPYEPTKDNELITSEGYRFGQSLAAKRGETNINKFFLDNAVKDGKKIKEYDNAMKGYYDQLSQEYATSGQGEKVVMMGSKESKLPTAVKLVSINLSNKGGNISYSVGDLEKGTQMDYMSLPQGMKDYVDRVDWMRRITGDEGTAKVQAGRGYAPY